MKYHYKAIGRAGFPIRFDIEIEEDHIKQLNQPVKLKIIDSVYGIYNDLDRMEDEFSQFNHPLNSKIKKQNSLYNFHKKISSYLYPYRYINKYLLEHSLELNAFIEHVQQRFINSLDPRCLKKAKIFLHNRWPIYCLLKQYDHPYLWQLCQTSPAIIILLASQNSALSDDFKYHILKKILAGGKPRLILEMIFDYLLAHCLDRLWDSLRSLPLDRRNKTRSDWVWMALHASRFCEESQLFSPPPKFLCKSDLPENKLRRAVWFKQIKIDDSLLIPELFEDQYSIEQIKGLSLFVSKLDKGQFFKIKKNKKEILKYLSESQTVLNSKSNFEKLITTSRNHESNKDKKISKHTILQAIARSAGVIHRGDLHIREENFKLDALTTLDALECESIQMSNCVYDQYPQAYLKEFVHFHVTIENTHYSLALSPKSQRIVDFKAAKNQSPHHAHVHFLQKKLCLHREKINHFLKLINCPT